MLLYNITYNIELEIESEWLDWMRLIHLPKVLASGYFTDYKIYKLLNVKDDGVTYSIQFFCTHIEKMQSYLEKEAALHAEEHNVRFRHKHVAFRTVLQEVDK
jgi:hypothetical protein